IELQARIKDIAVYGPFDHVADIDVFVLSLVTGGSSVNRHVSWWPDDDPATERFGRHFKVSVGTVVPHRDPQKGPWRSFATARQLSRWEIVDVGTLQKRRHKGGVHTPPFLAVRR